MHRFPSRNRMIVWLATDPPRKAKGPLANGLAGPCFLAVIEFSTDLLSMARRLCAGPGYYQLAANSATRRKRVPTWAKLRTGGLLYAGTPSVVTRCHSTPVRV